MEIRPTDEQLARQFVGSSALACRLAYDLIMPRTDPLGPENPLVFMTGPLVGTSAPSSSRYAVCARSPLTGIWGEATSGGSFGPRMKMAGYDGLVITGRAKRPTCMLLPGEDRFSIKGRVRDVIILQDVREVDNALLRCTFASLPLDVTAGLLSLATGASWTMEELLDRSMELLSIGEAGASWTMEELLAVGERSATLKRMLNCRLGVTRSDDRLPGILKRPYREGANAGFVPEEEEYLDEYYDLRGWDRETGRPGQERIKSLGLDV